MLNPTPQDRLVDRQQHPYFLWDCDMTLDEFRCGLLDPDPDARAYLIGKLMRQAKPDDVFTFVSPRAILELWPWLERYLGEQRRFWTFLFDAWKQQGQSDVCLVDLVADPAGTVEDPMVVETAGLRFSIDTPHEILVNKLCALLGRSELRDLQDVKALTESGVDLVRALSDAARKDGGFSPLTLAWVLKQLRVDMMARSVGLADEKTEALIEFQRQLIDRLAAICAPTES